ncbi:MAG TPA: hypothetical protein VKA49_21550 [Flavitalea sp.]|nr:hypothetical protein [Flavitalea sp.]
MKRQLLSIPLAVAFYLPAAASQTDTLPSPDFSKFQRVSVLGVKPKTWPGAFNAGEVQSFSSNITWLNYKPDMYQMKRNLSQDLYQLKIEKRNNEWRNLFAGLLTSVVQQ